MCPTRLPKVVKLCLHPHIISQLLFVHGTPNFRGPPNSFEYFNVLFKMRLLDPKVVVIVDVDLFRNPYLFRAYHLASLGTPLEVIPENFLE